MFRLASVLYIAGCIAAVSAASSIPVSTQPLVSTATITTVAPALSTSLETILSTSTVILYTTLTSHGKTVTSSVGQQLTIATSVSSAVATKSVTQLSLVVNTIGSTTIYGILPSSNSLATGSNVVPPAVAATSPTQTQSATLINTVASTASSTNLGETAPAAATSAASTNTASPSKSSKKLSTGAAVGIALVAAIVIGVVIGAIIVTIGKRRRQKRWGRQAATDSPSGESKKNLFSPDAGAGYDSMWKKPAASVQTGEIRPGTATTAEGRVSPIKHERGDSTTLGMDAPSIAPSGGNSTPKTDSFGDKPTKPVPNFSTPNRRSGSLTALPYCKP